jgi:hypothetical protein
MLWFAAFVWTLAIELPVYTIVLHRHARSWQRLCGLVLAVNAISHPVLWFAFPKLSPYWLYVLAGEACVIVIEALILASMIRNVRVALVASVLANLVSTVIGLGLLRLLGY